MDFDKAQEISKGEIVESFAIRTDNLVKWVVTKIKPISSEIKALGEVLGDPIDLVPWKAGIVVELVAMKVRTNEGEDIDTLTINSDGSVDFPKGYKGIRQSPFITAKGVEGKYVKFLVPGSKPGSTKWAVPTMPKASEWEAMNPTQRIGMWLSWMAMRLGLPSLNIGSVCYTFIKNEKTGKKDQKGRDEWRTDLNLSKVDSDKITHLTPFLINPAKEVERVPVPIVEKIRTILEAEKLKSLEDADSFNYGANVPTNQINDAPLSSEEEEMLRF